jgi:copper homeostasis protein
MTAAGSAPVLEIICCSLPDALAARDGGADRLEICSRLDLQGLTPPLDLVEQILHAVAVPVRVMIRVNKRFTATVDELSVMERQVAALAPLTLDGLVLGLHDDAGRLDFGAMDRVLRHAPAHWGWTLHRAFDYAVGEAPEKLAAVTHHARADRILSADSWRLTPPPALQFIAGGGLNAASLNGYLNSPCREFHFGRAARRTPDPQAPVDTGRVRELRTILDRDPGELATDRHSAAGPQPKDS